MPFTATPTAIADVILLEPKVFGDARGWFFESFNARDFAAATGVNAQFVQDNHSLSKKGVLRGLHYQTEQVQGKLVRVTSGAVFDVAVDLRRSSPNFGKAATFVLSEQNGQLVWIPPGYAHGFLVTSDSADVLYSVTDYRYPEDERTLLWCDPTLAINWPIMGDPPIMSQKDSIGLPYGQAELY